MEKMNAPVPFEIGEIPSFNFGRYIPGEIKVKSEAINAEIKKIKDSDVDPQDQIKGLIALIGPVTAAEIIKILGLFVTAGLKVWTEEPTVFYWDDVDANVSTEKLRLRVADTQALCKIFLENSPRKMLFRAELKHLIAEHYIYTSMAVIKMAMNNLEQGGVAFCIKPMTKGLSRDGTEGTPKEMSVNMFVMTSSKDAAQDILFEALRDRNKKAYKITKTKHLRVFLEEYVFPRIESPETYLSEREKKYINEAHPGKLSSIHLSEQEKKFTRECVGNFFLYVKHSNKTGEEMTWLISYLVVYLMRGMPSIRDAFKVASVHKRTGIVPKYKKDVPAMQMETGSSTGGEEGALPAHRKKESDLTCYEFKPTGEVYQKLFEYVKEKMKGFSDSGSGMTDFVAEKLASTGLPLTDRQLKDVAKEVLFVVHQSRKIRFTQVVTKKDKKSKKERKITMQHSGLPHKQEMPAGIYLVLNMLEEIDVHRLVTKQEDVASRLGVTSVTLRAANANMKTILGQLEGLESEVKDRLNVIVARK